MTRKPWSSGPFKSLFPISNPIHFEPPIEKPKKKFDHPKYDLIDKSKEKIKEKNYNKLIPWKDACVKSHELFIWETKKLTII